MRTAPAIVGLLIAAAGCAHGTTVEKIDVNTYRISCSELPLDRCLSETVSNTCNKRAYFVARGISDVNLRGINEAPTIATSSEAIVRCATSNGWGDEAKQLMAPPSAAPSPAKTPPLPSAAPSPPPAPAPAPVCTPGSTQSCVGAGACAGGQACRADGSGYDPCDCGSAAKP